MTNAGISDILFIVCFKNRIGAAGGANIIKERNCYMKYACEICGWEYDEETGDPENGLEPGTLFDELPDDFECPLCGAGKEDFAAV